MSEPTPCPFKLCTLTDPHPHPSLAEGLFAPHVSAEPRDNTATRIGDAPQLQAVPCRCRQCRATFTGYRFFAKPDASGYVLSTCESCADKAAERNEARIRPEKAPSGPKATFRDAARLARPYNDD